MNNRVNFINKLYKAEGIQELSDVFLQMFALICILQFTYV